jgi:hypothetical protein
MAERSIGAGTQVAATIDFRNIRTDDCPEVFSRCLKSSNNRWPHKA